MQRHVNWQSRLDEYLADNSARIFRYGSWDCALFVCGAIQVMTGVDPAVEFRGTYSSRKQARQVMRERAGTANFAEFFDRMAGRCEMPEIMLRSAARGDMALIRVQGRHSLGLISLNGRRIITVGETSLGANGLGFVDIDHGVRAWRV